MELITAWNSSVLPVIILRVLQECTEPNRFSAPFRGHDINQGNFLELGGS